MKVLIFPADTKCPMPRRYYARTRGEFVVYVEKMAEWEQEVWLMAMKAIGEDK